MKRKTRKGINFNRKLRKTYEKKVTKEAKLLITLEFKNSNDRKLKNKRLEDTKTVKFGLKIERSLKCKTLYPCRDTMTNLGVHITLAIALPVKADGCFAIGH